MSANKKKNSSSDEDVKASTTRNEELIRMLAQQQTILTNLVQTLAAQPTQQTVTQPPPPSVPTHIDRSVQLPRLEAPEELSIPAFRDWKQRWLDFSNSRQLTSQPLDAQHGVLRSALHPEWTQLWSFGRLNVTSTTTVADILVQLEMYLRQKRNPLLDRKEFHRRDQQQGESIDRYYATLKSLDDACSHDTELICDTCITPCPPTCNTCNSVFPLQKHLQDIRIRDHLICGLRSKEIQQRILTEAYSSNLTLERVLSICVAMENSIAVGASLAAAPPSQEINAAALKKSAFKRNQEQNRQQHQPLQQPEENCWNCGKFPRHPKRQCPAADVKCGHCGLLGHFTKLCFRKKEEDQQPERSHSPVKPKENNTVLINAATQQLLSLTTTVNGSSCEIKWLPDTGSEVNAISHADFLKLDPQIISALSPYKINVVGANNISLGPVGTFPAQLDYNGRTYSTTIGVFQNVSVPLLSLSGCKALGLVPPNWPNYQSSTLEARSTSIQSVPPSSSGPYIIPQRKKTAEPHTEARSEFQLGSIVLTQLSRSRRWNQTATIVEVHLSSYLLRTKDGRLLRRNRRLLRPYIPGTPAEDTAKTAFLQSSRNRRPPIRFAHSVQLSQRYNSEGGHEVSCVRIPLQPHAASPHGNAADSWPPANRKLPHSLHATQKKK